VAELSSSLAHEIKNPLASIRSSVEQLGKSSRANPDEKFLANLIVRESDRLSRLLSEFLDFSRVRVTECRPMDLHEVAAAAIRLVHQHPDCGAGVKIALEGGPTPMEGDEDLLHRVVSNLVLNAVQAAGSRAAVKVRTGLAAANELPGAAGIENPVALRVSDNGPGIRPSCRTACSSPSPPDASAVPGSDSPSCNVPWKRIAAWCLWTRRPVEERRSPFTSRLLVGKRRPRNGYGSIDSRHR